MSSSPVSPYLRNTWYVAGWASEVPSGTLFHRTLLARAIDKFKPDGAAWVERNIEGLMQPFTQEDLPMLEAQQEAIGDADFWSLRPALMTAVDAGAARARRVLDKLIADERGDGIVSR